MKPDVSVIICAYTEERWNDLLQVVQSVKEQTHQPREIILVIDHNRRLFERASSDIEGVQVFENAEGKGLRGGRNSGLAHASGELVAFVDDDAVAEPDWLERLVVHYRDPNVLGVGGLPLSDWLTPRPAWFPEEFNWVVGGAYKGMPQTRATVRNLFGCNMSFRREIFDVVGNFRIGYSCDETEFCIRARQHWPERTLVYEPRAVVHHKVPAGRGSWSYLIKRCYIEGRSKAVVAWMVGAQDGLASERAHVMKTLPLGVLRALGEAVRHRDPNGVARAAAIVAGVAASAAGYLTAKLSVEEAARERGYTGPAPTPAAAAARG